MVIKKFLTAKDSNKKLAKEDLENENINTNNKIEIDKGKTYQTMLGFGGAFSEAACYTLNKLSPGNREKILNAYFNREDGLGYNLGRISINSCDFSLENYDYVKEYDDKLETFNISREDKWVIPTIKEAINIRGENIKLLASPWSPPAWMKTNNDMNNGGKLLDKYKNIWADYYIKFINEYKKRDLDIWGVTVQNEPAAVQVWESCIYTSEEEREFVKNYLGPTFIENDLKDKKIIIWDHNRDKVIERATAILSDNEAAKYVWGTGIHWYLSEEFENVGEVHNRFPDKHLLFTEGTQEGGLHLGSWKTGERYARNIIGDLNNWVEGYLDWNLVLDEKGGPNHVGNYCDAPVIADIEKDQVIFNSSFYYIGHFSKYIEENAVRIKVENNNINLKVTAFNNPDDSVVIIILNETEHKEYFKLKYDEKNIKTNAPKRSIQTIIID